tara:strand:+ start:149 stop:664 length:516 start_codon:yes stop_codon:yes gene_type:complete
MKKLIKIKLIIIFIFSSAYSNATTNPPFKNIIVNKDLVEYKDISFKDIDGNTINLSDQQSKFYLLNFWATWCLPCKEEMPYLDKLQNEDGFQIFPINIEKNNKLKTKLFYKDLKIKNLSIYFDIENNLVNLFRLRGIPTTIILNEDKKEIARVIGVANLLDKKFIDWINSF